MSRETLTIGQVARAAGVNIETVRYYQRVNLIEEPRKPAKGYRHYPETVVQQLRFIKRAQRLGFGLDEIKQLMGLGIGRCSQVRKRARAQRNTIMEQIKDLQSLRRNLDRLITGCETRKREDGLTLTTAFGGSR